MDIVQESIESFFLIYSNSRLKCFRVSGPPKRAGFFRSFSGAEPLSLKAPSQQQWSDRGPKADVFLQCLTTPVVGGNGLNRPGGNLGFRVVGVQGLRTQGAWEGILNLDFQIWCWVFKPIWSFENVGMCKKGRETSVFNPLKDLMVKAGG